MYYVIQINKNKAQRIKNALGWNEETGIEGARLEPGDEITEVFPWPGHAKGMVRISCCGNNKALHPEFGAAYAQAALTDENGRIMEISGTKGDFFGEWVIGGQYFLVVAEPELPETKYDRRADADGRLDCYIPDTDDDIGSHPADLTENGSACAPTTKKTVAELAPGDMLDYMCPFCGKVHPVRVYKAERIAAGEHDLAKVRFMKTSFICQNTGKEFIPFADLELKNREAAGYAIAKNAVGEFTELLEYTDTDDGYERDIPDHMAEGLDSPCFTVLFRAPDKSDKGHTAVYRCFINAKDTDQALAIFFRNHPHVSYSMTESCVPT